MPRLRPLHMLLGLLVAAGLVNLWSMARGSVGIDFYQMWVGSRIARETKDFYTTATRDRMGEEYVRRAAAEEPTRRMVVARFRRRLETVGTPFMYLSYASLHGSYERDLLLFQGLMMIGFLTWVTIVARLSGHGWTTLLALLALLLWNFEPVRSDMRVVNMNHAILLLLAAAACSLEWKRPAITGVLLAVAILTKPYVILTLPLLAGMWVMQRRWRELVRLAAGAGIATTIGVLASSLYFRSASIWAEWLRSFRAIPPEMISPDLGNFALSPLVRRATGFPLAPLLTCMLAITTLLMFRRAARTVANDRLTIWLACVLFQLGSPLVWVHYLLLSVPLAIHLLGVSGRRPPVGRSRDHLDDSEPYLPGAGKSGIRIRHAVSVASLVVLAVEPWSSLITESLTTIAVVVNVALTALCVAAMCELVAEGSTASALDADLLM